MDNALKSFEYIKNQIEDFNPRLILFCVDFDGTLVKIQKNPYTAYLEPDHRKIIGKIINMHNIYFCIVTGRGINDIKNRIGFTENIIYSGNHGFEIKSLYDNFKLDYLAGGQESARFVDILKKIEKDLKKIKIPDLIIENKKYSISLHYRMLNGEETAKLKRETKEIFNANDKYKAVLQLKTGKKILEVRPKLNWDKGIAVRYISEKLAAGYSGYFSDITQSKAKTGKTILKILRFNIGDDLTDETMFYDKSYDIRTALISGDANGNIKDEAINAEALSIGCVIGEKKSLADYYIDNYNQTYILIQKLADLFCALHPHA